MPSKDQQQYRWEFGAGTLDETSLTFTRHGEPVRLEPKPLKLLALLLRNAGEVVTRAEIQAEVWDDRVTVANTIPTAVGKLRKALDDDCKVRIETVPRSGYRLVGEFERTAVGRVASNRLALVGGDPVPLRPDWLLTEQINATAYSDIWLARDRSGTSRRIFKFAVDGSRLSSLKREAALNRLLSESLGKRDDIAAMVDTNFAEPPFFLAYEHEGRNLREWAETDTRFGGLDLGQRLALFSRICAAVSAAHGVGILHKDIKPENILVAERAEGELAVKLGDFSSSELLEPEQLDRLRLTRDDTAGAHDGGEGAGTFMYMAPELLQTGTATVRSDVFALGVVLFQMLAGDFRRALAPGWRREIDDELLIEDIAAATDRDPARRPASAAELARRIDNLESRRREAEESRLRRTELERTQRELERQRARRPWVRSLVATLVVGLGISVYLYREAEEGRRQAEAFVERMESVRKFLSEDVIGRANPLAPEYDPDAGISSVLAGAAAQIDDRFGGSPRAAGALHRSIANAFAALRQDEKALAHYTKARERYADALGARHPATIEVAYEQADVLVNAQRYDRAQAFLAEVDELAGELPQQAPELGFRRAYSYARLHAGLHDVPSAVDFFRQAERFYRQAGMRDPEQFARLELGLVDAYIRLDQPDRALEALAAIRDESPDSILPPDVRALTTKNRARVQRDLGNDQEALALAREAAIEMTDLYGEAHYQTITTLSLVAQLQARLDDCDGTLATSQRVFELMRDLYGADNSGTLIEQSNLGTKQFACGRPTEGIANLRIGIEGLDEQFGERNRAVHQLRFFLAKYLHQTDQHRESLELLTHLETVALDKTQGLAITPAQILLWRGRALDALGRFSEARQALQRALQFASKNDTDQEILQEIDAELLALSSRKTSALPGS